ncbi:60S ribosomal protein L28-like protein [Leptotrombidium deliense]|uniref:Large ribosomal subunit protein eL28 n=1 Tax=Leptotrombidium deliense TaxID=299467 RepID=A0A443SRA1_9ACAR|nr:60S ribosomal protein L28-like protein [Leptotrombidium deliense]
MKTAGGINVSRDLLWMLTKNNSCHLIKRPALKPLTKDPMNPKGIHSLRFAGSVQRKAMNVQAHPSGKGVQLVFNKRRHQKRPAKRLAKISLTKNSRKTLSTIRKFSNKFCYRTDLKNACLRRASAILRSQQPKTPSKKTRGKKE